MTISYWDGQKPIPKWYGFRAGSVWQDQLFLISELGELCCLHLLGNSKNDSEFKLLKKDVVHEDLSSLVVMVTMTNQIYIIGEGVREDGICHLGSATFNMISLKNTALAEVYPMQVTTYRNMIIIIGAPYDDEDDDNGEDNDNKTILQCIDVEKDTKYRMADINEKYNWEIVYHPDGCEAGYNPSVFQTLEDTFILYPNGNLWKLLEDEETKQLKPQLVMQCWKNGPIPVSKATLMRGKLFLFTNSEEKYLMDKSVFLEGAFQEIILISCYRVDGSVYNATIPRTVDPHIFCQEIEKIKFYEDETSAHQ